MNTPNNEWKDKLYDVVKSCPDCKDDPTMAPDVHWDELESFIASELQAAEQRGREECFRDGLRSDVPQWVKEAVAKAREEERKAVARRLRGFWHDNYGMDENGNEYIYKKQFDEFVESLLPNDKKDE